MCVRERGSDREKCERVLVSTCFNPHMKIQPKVFLFLFFFCVILIRNSRCFATLQACRCVLKSGSRTVCGSKSISAITVVYPSPVGWACGDDDSLRSDKLKACMSVHVCCLCPLSVQHSGEDTRLNPSFQLWVTVSGPGCTAVMA